MNEKKYEYLVKVFGEDEAAKIKAEQESKAKTLSEIAEYKEFFSVSDATAPEAEKEHNHAHDSEVETALKSVVADIIPEMGEIADMQLGMAKKVKEQAATISTLITQIKNIQKHMNIIENKLEVELKAKPRAASEADETELDVEEMTDDMKKKFQDKEAGEKDSFWGNFLEKEVK